MGGFCTSHASFADVHMACSTRPYAIPKQAIWHPKTGHMSSQNRAQGIPNQAIWHPKKGHLAFQNGAYGCTTGTPPCLVCTPEQLKSTEKLTSADELVSCNGKASISSCKALFLTPALAAAKSLKSNGWYRRSSMASVPGVSLWECRPSRTRLREAARAGLEALRALLIRLCRMEKITLIAGTGWAAGGP